MVHGEHMFTFTIDQQYQTHTVARVSIEQSQVKSLYNQALLAQKAEASTYGFPHGDTPLFYIEQNFKSHIIDHLKELLFTHCVMGFLCDSIYTHKLVTVGDPILTDIMLDPAQGAHYSFILAHAHPEREERWKRLHLRPPERKNYKDLDKQVESFIKEETDNVQRTNNTISMGDWVCFDMWFINSQQQPLLTSYKDTLWVKISDEEADLELHTLFLGKKQGDTFHTQSSVLQNYVSNKLNMHYTFAITIKDFLPNNHFSFDFLKRHFGIKSSKEVHQKLIEVFSYRNDLSQRRETIEATFKLLLKHYILFLPKHLVERQRQLVLATVHVNPDYHVYKAQNDFKEKIRLLAEKQLKEAIITDTIAYQENIRLLHDDIAGYLNLIKRPRTKEFVYFDIPATKARGHEVPISEAVLKQYCLREKTLNYVIQYLTKKS